MILLKTVMARKGSGCENLNTGSANRKKQPLYMPGMSTGISEITLGTHPNCQNMKTPPCAGNTFRT